jgi:glutathione S-transferase
MLTLYHCMSARSFRPLWTMEEMGLGYELKMLPFPPRVFKKDYLALNPLGTIPFFVDGETRMTESCAIPLYLVSKYGPTPLNVGVDEPDYGKFLNALLYGEATLTFPQTIFLRYTLQEPDRGLDGAASDYVKWFGARLRAATAVVADNEYYCSGRFTIADICVGYALMLAERLKIDHVFSDPVRAYWQRLTQRDGYKRALASQEKAAAEQGLVEPPMTRAAG